MYAALSWTFSIIFFRTCLFSHLDLFNESLIAHELTLLKSLTYSEKVYTPSVPSGIGSLQHTVKAVSGRGNGSGFR